MTDKLTVGKIEQLTFCGDVSPVKYLTSLSKPQIGRTVDNLFTALGLLKGSIYVVESLENTGDINKVGLISNLKKVQSILEEFLNDR